MYRWIILSVVFGVILALTPAGVTAQELVPSPKRILVQPPPPPPVVAYPPGIAVYRVYYYHTLRPWRVRLYGTYTDYNSAAAAANYWNSRPRFKAYIG